MAILFLVSSDGQTLPDPRPAASAELLRQRLAGLRDLGYGGAQYGVPILEAGPDMDDMVAACIAFLSDRRLVVPARPKERGEESYCLKGCIERRMGYVTNGACIAAALMLGFNVARVGTGPGSPNAWLGCKLTRLGKKLDAIARGARS